MRVTTIVSLLGLNRLGENEALSSVDSGFDEAANAMTQVEISAETGIPGSYKLYIHQGGKTVVRICKIKGEQLLLPKPFSSNVKQDVALRKMYEQGVEDGMSRARSKPGDGDMGG